MKDFKVGDFVHTEEEFWLYGKIVDIKDNTATVEFATSGGGGCLPFELKELKPMWCITSDLGIEGGNCNSYHLGWQNPAWDDDGYFWTSKETINEIAFNNTPEHPFLFCSKESAIKLLKSLKMEIRCRVIEWQKSNKK